MVWIFERMDKGELTKRIYRSKIDAANVRGRQPIKWEDRVMEYEREFKFKFIYFHRVVVFT